MSWAKCAVSMLLCIWLDSGIILCIGSSSERRHYSVTSSFISWAHTEWSLWFFVMFQTKMNNCYHKLQFINLILLPSAETRMFQENWPCPYACMCLLHNILLYCAVHFWYPTLSLICNFPQSTPRRSPMARLWGIGHLLWVQRLKEYRL